MAPKSRMVQIIELTEYIDNVTRERDHLQATLNRLTDLAGDFIGTDPELRSEACIEVAIQHGQTLSDNLAKVRRENDHMRVALLTIKDYAEKHHKPTLKGLAERGLEGK